MPLWKCQDKLQQTGLEESWTALGRMESTRQLRRERFIFLYSPIFSIPPGSLISAGGDRRCSPCCSFMLEWCVMNRGETPALLIPGICNNSAGAPGSHCSGRTRARTGTRWKEPKKGKKGKAPKPQRMGTPFSSLCLHFGVSRAPFPVTPGMDSAVEPP